MTLPVDITSYDRIAVMLSGGKDSLAALVAVLDAGADPSRIELHHHDVDGEGGSFMDWPVTPSYCMAVARAFNLPLYFSGKEGGFEREMDRADTPTAPTYFYDAKGTRHRVGGKGPKGSRGKFPQVSADLKVRWCSAYLKIDVMDRVLCNDPRFTQGRTLIVTGERAEESTSRAKYATFEAHRADSRDAKRNARYIDHWRPVHAWKEADVWAAMQRRGIVPHPAYRLGWGRLSCLSCIFGSASQWATIAAVMPARFELVANKEAGCGVTIQRKLSVRELAVMGTPYPAALAQPELVAMAMGRHYTDPVLVDPAAWVLPAGAFGESAGPT